MSTVTTYKLNNLATQPYRQAHETTITANFGLELQPSLSLDSINLVDTNGAKNSQMIRTSFLNNPVEGVPYSINIQSNNTITPINFAFNFYTDYTKMKFLSDVETEIGLIEESSLDAFNFRAQGITQTLLEFKNIILGQDFQACPYVVKNRKTLLERIQILAQGFLILKIIADEIFKLVNISADVTSGGIAQAFINLATTILAIGLLIIQLKNILTQIQESFFPPVLYHSGIKPKTFIEKAVVNYMGYSAVNFGTLSPIMELLTFLGSKNNQIGAPNPFVPLNSGVLNPSNVGYDLQSMIDLLKEQFRLRDAIIDNVYHLRPENDPFWVNNASYTMPKVLVELVPTGNGTIRPNYEDLKAATIIQYLTDDSDLWTLDDLANESDPNSTGKIITVTTVEPINVVDQRRVLLQGLKNIDIPYALAVRNDVLDNLLNAFIDTSSSFNTIKQIIENKISELASFFSAGNPNIEEFINSFGNRTGVLKVENHFFSVPKMMLLEDNLQGLPRIPVDFVDQIGAAALYRDYHTWDSFIPGQRNPNNLNETAAKFIFEQVRIPFGVEDFNTILNNSYFTTQDGITGKFMKLDWNVEGDFAICDYWIYENWMSNIQETIT